MILLKLLMLIAVPFLLRAADGEPHHTTAFISPPGTFESIAAYSFYKTDHFWNKNGRRLPSYNHFELSSAYLYSEYALNFCNSFTFNGRYDSIDETLNGHHQGFEEIEFGWKHLLLGDDKRAFTTQFLAIIPGGKTKTSLRYGECGVQFNLLYSEIFSVFKKCGWCDFALGYRYYQHFPSDQIRASAAIGYDILPKGLIILSTQIEYGLYNGGRHHHISNIRLNPNYRLISIQMEGVITPIQHFSAILGAFSHLWGRNVGVGGGIFGGVRFDY